MTTILCYGDSNTYGYNPVNGLRYPKGVRWTGVLQKMLGEEYEVIEEGCNGRTTVFEDAKEPWKAGLGYLRPCHKGIYKRKAGIYSKSSSGVSAGDWKRYCELRVCTFI